MIHHPGPKGLDVYFILERALPEAETVVDALHNRFKRSVGRGYSLRLNDYWRAIFATRTCDQQE